MRSKIEKPPILLTGCARSGTSMAAGVINMCGAFGGNLAGPTRNNAKGMFENSDIRNTITKPFLDSIGCDPLGQYPLVDVRKLRIPVDWADRVCSVMIRQGYQSGPWFYKGAKMCQFWPVWDYAFPNAKWIIVRRKDEDIVNSCLRTGFMHAFRDAGIREKIGAKTEAEGWQWWVNQHKRRFEEMIQAGLNAKVVWPERMVNGDYELMKDAVEWCGLEWTNQVYEFVSPKLWKGKK